MRLREYLLKRGVNPIALMMQWGLHSPTTLAAELGCSRLEAFRELRAVWAELGPYFASKLVAVDDQGKPAQNVMIRGTRPDDSLVLQATTNDKGEFQIGNVSHLIPLRFPPC